MSVCHSLLQRQRPTEPTERFASDHVRYVASPRRRAGTRRQLHSQGRRSEGSGNSPPTPLVVGAVYALGGEEVRDGTARNHEQQTFILPRAAERRAEEATAYAQTWKTRHCPDWSGVRSACEGGESHRLGREGRKGKGCTCKRRGRGQARTEGKGPRETPQNYGHKENRRKGAGAVGRGQRRQPRVGARSRRTARHTSGGLSALYGG